MNERRENPENTGLTNSGLSRHLARWFDAILHVLLLIAILVHVLSRVGLFFVNPISTKLEGKHTFIWFLAVFAIWFSRNLLTGRLARKPPRDEP
jgi:hypothetical protein